MDDTTALADVSRRIGNAAGSRRQQTIDTPAGTAERRTHGWLTTVLRPAGTLDQPALRRLRRALEWLAVGSDMIVIDLTATHVSAPRALARSLRTPARQLQQPGRCLLLIGVPAELARELDRAAVQVATLAAEALPTLAG
jgi:hypothetical protein